MSMIAIGTIYPVVFVLNVSLKDKRSYILDQFGLTDTLHTANFGDAWRRSNLSRYMINSTIVTAGSVAVLLLLGSLAGYAFAQLSFKISKGAYLACLGALMIPFQVIMVPFVRMMLDIGLTNTYWGLILAYTSIFLPFTVYLMASFYRRIPRASPRRRPSTGRRCGTRTGGSSCRSASQRCCRSEFSTRCSSGTTCSSRSS